MIGMIYSHRYEKGDNFIKEISKEGHSLDFELIRDVMYKYNKKAEDNFLADPILSFILINFADFNETEYLLDEWMMFMERHPLCIDDDNEINLEGGKSSTTT